MSEGMSITSYIFGIPIAVVYAYLFSKIVDIVADVVYGGDIPSYTYTFITPRSLVDDSFEADSKLSKEALNKANEIRQLKNNFKFYFDVFGGLAGIIAGVLIAQKTSLKTGGFGIGFGGVILLLYHVADNWYSLDKYMKLLILAISFATLLYGSYIFIR